MDFSKSALLLERAKKVLAGGVSSEFRKFASPHAMFYSKGQGASLWDVDGNQFLDFTLSQGPLILGHSHPEVLKSVSEYSELGQLFAGQHIKELELAEKLNEVIPSAELIRFCLDGSGANQIALRIARAKTGKEKFIRFEGHYHGWIDNVAWNISGTVETLGSRANPNHIPWSEGITPSSGQESIVLPWNDLDLLTQTIENNHNEIAAVITEPIMCNNGCIVPKDGYLEGMRKLCDKYNITLIFDEVICGFRVALGGAQSYFNVIPDLSVFGKAMANGYPISAIVGKREWMKLVEESKVIHAGTMNSNNPTVAAALATINILQRDAPYNKLYELGNKLISGIKLAAEKHNQNLIVQGPGPMFATLFGDQEHLNDFRDVQNTDKSKTLKFVSLLYENNIRVIRRGLWYISAAHEEKDIDHTLEVIDQVLYQL